MNKFFVVLSHGNAEDVATQLHNAIPGEKTYTQAQIPFVMSNDCYYIITPPIPRATSTKHQALLVKKRIAAVLINQKSDKYDGLVLVNTTNHGISRLWLSVHAANLGANLVLCNARAPSTMTDLGKFQNQANPSRSLETPELTPLVIVTNDQEIGEMIDFIIKQCRYRGYDAVHQSEGGDENEPVGSTSFTERVALLNRAHGPFGATNKWWTKNTKMYYKEVVETLSGDKFRDAIHFANRIDDEIAKNQLNIQASFYRFDLTNYDSLVDYVLAIDTDWGDCNPTTKPYWKQLYDHKISTNKYTAQAFKPLENQPQLAILGWVMEYLNEHLIPRHNFRQAISEEAKANILATATQMYNGILPTLSETSWNAFIAHASLENSITSVPEILVGTRRVGAAKINAAYDAATLCFDLCLICNSSVDLYLVRNPVSISNLGRMFLRANEAINDFGKK